MRAEHEGETSTMDVSEARNQGEHCGRISTMDCAASNKPILFPSLFQGEMDPMTFVEEDNASELQPYQRVEQIQNDYEILAAKKRSALDREICEIPGKRFRQEEFLGASLEEIMEIINFGMKKKVNKGINKVSFLV